LLINDYRLTTGSTTFFAWESGEAEPSVTVELVSFECSRRKFIYECRCLAIISLHSLARRFQRCSANDDTAIIADIAACIDARDAIMAGSNLDSKSAAQMADGSVRKHSERRSLEFRFRNFTEGIRLALQVKV
jgi:hypothetical protein